MSSLNKLTATDAARRIAAGEVSSEAIVADCLAHIREREPSVMAWQHLDEDHALGQAPATAAQLAAAIYTETPPALLGAATRNVLAHLIDLTGKNRVAPVESLTATATFRRV